MARRNLSCFILSAPAFILYPSVLASPPPLLGARKLGTSRQPGANILLMEVAVGHHQGATRLGFSSMGCPTDVCHRHPPHPQR